ncbi:unnamed protein product [Discula destructiva]
MLTSWDVTIAALAGVSPAQWVQTLFLLASGFVLAITVAPAAERKLLLNYGARREEGPVGPSKANKIAAPISSMATDETEQHDSLVQAVRKVTALGQVPHAWFFAYYACYLVFAVGWAAQYFLEDNDEGQHSNLLGFLARRQVALASPDAPTMAGGQVVMLWAAMILQTGRRLYECFAVTKPSKATMWFVHWVMGLGFYLGVSVAIWVEGSAALLHKHMLLAEDFTADAQLKAGMALPLLFYGWVRQHQCHKHLAGLRKYSLPNTGMFEHLVCPHYTCECLVYFSMAVLGAPAGQWCNRTLLSVLTFVAVNLGVTAHGTRSWYVDKFGPEALVGRWIMIPFVY